MNSMVKKGEGKGCESRIMLGRQVPALISILPVMRSGSLTASLNGLPVVSIDSEFKTLRIEVGRLKASDLKLRGILGNKIGPKAMLRNAERIAKKFSEIGWTMTLYDGNDRLLSMGSKASRLTGHIHVNPMKLRKLFKSLG